MLSVSLHNTVGKNTLPLKKANFLVVSAQNYLSLLISSYWSNARFNLFKSVR